MIIAIAGPSCSGKTTLARLVGERLDAPTFHLDRHYVADCEHPLVAGFPSFERPHQYDARALRREIEAACRHHLHVVAEGFLLLAYPEIAALADAMAVVDVPHDVLVERRLARAAAKAALADVSGGRSPKADDGWHAHGREEWERFGAPQALIPGVRVVRSRMHGGTDPDAPEAIADLLVAEWVQGPDRT